MRKSRTKPKATPNPSNDQLLQYVKYFHKEPAGHLFGTFWSDFLKQELDRYPSGAFHNTIDSDITPKLEHW